MLGASLVDLGGAALLTEYPVCENDGELNQSGTPHGINRHGSEAKAGRDGRAKAHQTRNGWRTARSGQWCCRRSSTGCSARPPRRAAASARQRGSAPSPTAAGRGGAGEDGSDGARWGLELGDFGGEIWAAGVSILVFPLGENQTVRVRGTPRREWEADVPLSLRLSPTISPL